MALTMNEAISRLQTLRGKVPPIFHTAIDQAIDTMRKADGDAAELKEWRKYMWEKNMYRWHDLRKDPEDRPEPEEKVIVTLANGTMDVSVYTYGGDFRPWYSNFIIFVPVEWNDPVIAWKRVDPFEEVEG